MSSAVLVPQMSRAASFLLCLVLGVLVICSVDPGIPIRGLRWQENEGRRLQPVTCVHNTDPNGNAWWADPTYDTYCPNNGAQGHCPSPMCTAATVVTGTSTTSSSTAQTSNVITNHGATVPATSPPGASSCIRNPDCNVNPWCSDPAYNTYCPNNGASGNCPFPACTWAGGRTSALIPTTGSSTHAATPKATASTSRIPFTGQTKATTAVTLSTRTAATTATTPSTRTASTPSTGVSLPSPRRVLYIDYADVDWNNAGNTVIAGVNAGYNVILLAFLLSSTPADVAQVWATTSAANRATAISYAHAHGAVVMVSAAGSTDLPWQTFPKGADYGSYAGQWAKTYNLDGVDFDVENFAPGFAAGNMNGAQLSQWLADASTAAKQFVSFVSHAPQAPYFGPIGNANFWAGTSGGYSAVEAKSNGAVDFYNVQFYNQGGSCYTSFVGIFQSSASDCPVFPGTSVQEIVSYGVPMSKITVTKPVLTSDASNGYTSPGDLNNILKQAANIGYHGGASCWVFHASASSMWIAGVCSGGVC